MREMMLSIVAGAILQRPFLSLYGSSSRAGTVIIKTCNKLNGRDRFCQAKSTNGGELSTKSDEILKFGI